MSPGPEHPPVPPDRGRPLHRIRLDGPELRVVRGELVLGPGNSRHLREVLRLRPGDLVRGLAGGGLDYLLRVERLRPGQLVCTVAGTVEVRAEPDLAVTVCQALTRPERFEYTLQKCTEIGAAAFVPVVTRRSIVRRPERGSAPRLGRWQRIVEEAALQSGRGTVPPVSEPVELEALLSPAGPVPGLAGGPSCPRGPYGLRLVAYEEESRPLGPLLRQAAASGDGPVPPTAAMVIGPEGGLEAAEVAKLAAAGFVPVSLGPRVLRAETAGPVMLTMLLYELGDLGGPRR